MGTIPEYPRTSVALSALKIAALAFVVFIAPEERTRFIAAIRWAAGLMSAKPEVWPVDLGRPVSEAQAVIANHHAASLWWADLADALDVISHAL